MTQGKADMRRPPRKLSPIWAAIVGGALVFALFAVPGHASAQALDNGFCGVRVAGPLSGTGGNYGYQITNKCSSTIDVRVDFPNIGKATGCSSVRGGWGEIWWVPYNQTNWTIENC